MEINAKVATLPVEEIIFNHEVIILPLENSKRLVVKKYIRETNKYLMSDGNHYNRNQFIPLAKFAITKEDLGTTVKVLGRLQYKMQNAYKDGDRIKGKVNIIPNKIRLNDTVMVKDSAHVKFWDMEYNWGVVTNLRVTSSPGAVEITLPNGDELTIFKKELLILGRPSTCAIFNIIDENGKIKD